MARKIKITYSPAIDRVYVYHPSGDAWGFSREKFKKFQKLISEYELPDVQGGSEC